MSPAYVLLYGVHNNNNTFSGQELIDNHFRALNEGVFMVSTKNAASPKDALLAEVMKLHGALSPFFASLSFTGRHDFAKGTYNDFLSTRFSAFPYKEAVLVKRAPSVDGL